MKFTKMEGLGNDYVYVDCFKESVLNPEKAAKVLSDRHTGVGGDGLILICPSSVADFCMKVYNADGSQAEMCGNAIRCVGKYVYEKGLTQKTHISIETLAGIKHDRLHVKDGKVMEVTADMGSPEYIGNVELTYEKDIYKLSIVDMGNPHAVMFVNDVHEYPVDKIGPYIENHPMFKYRTNVEFVQVIDSNSIRVRVWERGSGETAACGTGACAACVSGIKTERLAEAVDVYMPGGCLQIKYKKETNKIYMTGPARITFEGCTDIV